MQAFPFLRQPAQKPSQKPPPSTGGAAAELAKILGNNKRLREEVTKHQLANKKSRGQPSPSAITLPALFFLYEESVQTCLHGHSLYQRQDLVPS